MVLLQRTLLHVCSCCLAPARRATTTMSADALPEGLSQFLQTSFSKALARHGPPPPAATSEALVAQLARLAAAEPDASAWAHEKGRRLATSLERDAAVARSVVSGEMDARAVLDHDAAHRQNAEAMFATITSHHDQLKETQWEEAKGDGDALAAYAAAATQIGEREWVQLGVDWMADFAATFYRRGGAATLARREATRRHWAAAGAALDADAAAALRDELAADAELSFASERPIRLLDVGSCGTLFDGVAGLEATALDLHPQAGNARVHQCDFLALEVGPAGSAPVIEPHAEFAAGSLRRLPAASYDAVALSLVLSYLPTARQRAAMVAQARRLLPAPGAGSRRRGLLLLQETLSVDRKATRWDEQTSLQAWVAAVEQLGFKLLRHQALRRSHALAFATEEVDADELERRLADDALPLTMVKRSELRGAEAEGDFGPELRL